MKIFTIGGSGMVGSRIVELLGKSYEFEDLSLEQRVDVTKPETLQGLKNYQEKSLVIHFAAKADVDACEKDKPLKEQGDAFRINVLGTKNVVDACRETNKKILYISTDFVFDGVNPPVGGYTEEDKPNPINWYGRTKYLGEEFVKSSGVPYIIVRIAYPYRKEFSAKKDFVRAILDQLQNNQQISCVVNHLITPTFIDDIAVAIDKLIKTNSNGIFHVVGSESISPYDAAMMMALKFHYNPYLINKITGTEYYKDKAPRPSNLIINNGKIGKLGVKMRTFGQGLDEFAK